MIEVRIPFPLAALKSKANQIAESLLLKSDSRLDSILISFGFQNVGVSFFFLCVWFFFLFFSFFCDLLRLNYITHSLCFQVVRVVISLCMASASSYEDARKQHVEENKKRLEDLGVSKISRSLSLLTNSNSKSEVYLHSVSRQFPLFSDRLIYCFHGDTEASPKAEAGERLHIGTKTLFTGPHSCRFLLRRCKDSCLSFYSYQRRRMRNQSTRKEL